MSRAPLPIGADLLRRIPKAELHCHLDGSLRPTTLLELAREYGKPLPETDPERLAAFMRVRDGETLEAYLQRFDLTLSVMQTAAALERIAYELAEDAARDGVRYIEVRYAPVLNTREGLSLEDVLDASIRGLHRAERQHGVVGRVIVCALRTHGPDESLALARLAVEGRGMGVAGFDLAGLEAGHPASRHGAAFAYAREHDLACTCHAGEGDGAASIRSAVHSCGVHRVGHGTRLFEDESLLDYVNDRRVPVEVCLTSNVQTGAAPSLERHPARDYIRRGINVVLNTDNRLMSGTTLTEEYARAASAFSLDLDACCRLALNGFESAFLPWPERQTLIRGARRDMRSLGAVLE